MHLHRSQGTGPGCQGFELQRGSWHQGTKPSFSCQSPPLHAFHLCVHLSVQPFAPPSTYLSLHPSIHPCVHPATQPAAIFTPCGPTGLEGWTDHWPLSSRSPGLYFCPSRSSPLGFSPEPWQSLVVEWERVHGLLPARKALLSMVPLGWTHTATGPLPEPEVYPQEGWQLYFCQVVVCVSGAQKGREGGAGAGEAGTGGRILRERLSQWDTPISPHL